MGGKNATEMALADRQGIARAAAILERGGLVAVPTETVYGLAARADSAEAVAAIYAAKGRPGFNPLIVHVRSVEQAAGLADMDQVTRQVAEQVWPGPLTLVCPRRADVALADAVTAGLPTVALRAPSHSVMQELLAAVDFPLAAPSANRSGFISPTRAEHVLATLDGRIDMVLDAGEPCANGLESTILAIRSNGRWDELRPGPIDLDALRRQFGVEQAPAQHDGAAIEAPGQLASHYAPGKPVRLDAAVPRDDEFMIGFGNIAGDISLSPSGDLSEAAARLYDCLHQAAQVRQRAIAVAPIPATGLGKAINDRLRRAAA